MLPHRALVWTPGALGPGTLTRHELHRDLRRAGHRARIADHAGYRRWGRPSGGPGRGGRPRRAGPVFPAGPPTSGHRHSYARDTPPPRAGMGPAPPL